MAETGKQILEYKKACEANIVSILWKSPELLYDYDNLSLNDFSDNCWKVYFVIAYEIVVKEHKKVLDDITVNLYLKEHPKLNAKYNEYGGYETITNAQAYVKVENLDGYVKQLNKWKVVINLLKNKFPVHDKIKDFIDMSVDEIYSEYEAFFNHCFINCYSEIKSYNLLDGMHKTLDDLRKGKNVGMPLYGSPMLNKLIGGSLNGNITMISAASGIGKTTFTICLQVTSLIKSGETCCIMINEQNVEKWREEMILWYANNELGGDIAKYKLRDGLWNDDEDKILRKAADWLEEQRDKQKIIIIPFETYDSDTVIKIIKKYSSGFNCKYFILDTFKASSGIKGEQVWLSMMQDSVKLYDTIKPANKNVHLWITSQLDKGSTKQRYLTNSNISMSKNVIDVVSTSILIRRPFEDEYSGEKKELTCYKLDGKYGNTKIPFKLDRKEHYVILFISKNRFGTSGDYQLVCRFDLSKNKYIEEGIVHIEPDF